jgi:hypothetical protein
VSIIRKLSFVGALAALLLAPNMVAGQGTEISARGSSLRIGGRIHSQFAHSSVESARAANFFIRRTRIVFDVKINDLVSGKLEHDFVAGLRDAYFRLNLDPAFRVSVGQFKRSFDIFELFSSTQVSVVERGGGIPGLSTCEGILGICSYSRFTEKLLYSGRDVGVRVDGSVGGATYQVSITNGPGARLPEVNDAKSFAGRLVVPMDDNLRLGGNFSVHDYITEFDGELDSESGNLVGFEPVARVSWGEPNGDKEDDSGTLLSPGFMVYFKQRTRVGTSLDVWTPQTGNTEYSLKVQLYVWF